MENLKKCLDEIKHWMNSNYLKINVNKTQVMCVGSKRLHSLYGNRLNCIIKEKLGIESSQIFESVKTLGVVLDQDLSMKKSCFCL